jgi:hypothetical protein
MAEDRVKPLPNWELVTSHGLVLLYVALNPDATIRRIAASLELTERRVADLIWDLANADLLVVSRRGRRNHYALAPGARFRHPLIADTPFQSFVSLVRRHNKRPAAAVS